MIEILLLLNYCRKEEFSVIILGLDGAGKTVRSQQTPCSRSSHTACVDATREDQDFVQ